MTFVRQNINEHVETSTLTRMSLSQNGKKEQLPIRKQAVEDRAIDTQQLLEKQLKELKKQKKRISGWSISQIINRDNIDMIFQITNNQMNWAM